MYAYKTSKAKKIDWSWSKFGTWMVILACILLFWTGVITVIYLGYKGIQ